MSVMKMESGDRMQSNWIGCLQRRPNRMMPACETLRWFAYIFGDPRSIGTVAPLLAHLLNSPPGTREAILRAL
jgi:hypothetical protein